MKRHKTTLYGIELKQVNTYDDYVKKLENSVKLNEDNNFYPSDFELPPSSEIETMDNNDNFEDTNTTDNIKPSRKSRNIGSFEVPSNNQFNTDDDTSSTISSTPKNANDDTEYKISQARKEVLKHLLATGLITSGILGLKVLLNYTNFGSDFLNRIRGSILGSSVAGAFTFMNWLNYRLKLQKYLEECSETDWECKNTVFREIQKINKIALTIGIPLATIGGVTGFLTSKRFFS